MEDYLDERQNEAHKVAELMKGLELLLFDGSKDALAAALCTAELLSPLAAELASKLDSVSRPEAAQ